MALYVIERVRLAAGLVRLALRALDLEWLPLPARTCPAKVSHLPGLAGEELLPFLGLPDGALYKPQVNNRKNKQKFINMCIVLRHGNTQR